MNNAKLSQLKELGSQRQSKVYDGYSNLSDFHNGVYETDFVSPYTKTAHNVDSLIVLVLQDWASSDSLNAVNIDQDTVQLGYTPTWPTNTNLRLLLEETYNLRFQDVFITNLFPFIKKGNVSASIRQSDFNRAFEEFCWPQIKIVQPKLVVCLGSAVYYTFAKNLPSPKGSRNYAVGDSLETAGITIYYQCHPGARGMKRRGRDKVFDDWMSMKKKVSFM